MKPAWRANRLSREVFKSLAKTAVDKVCFAQFSHAVAMPLQSKNPLRKAKDNNQSSGLDELWNTIGQNISQQPRCAN